MPTPADRILASEKVSEEIIRRRLFKVYQHQYNLLDEDLKARLSAIKNGLLGWGGDNPKAQEAALRKAMADLKKRMLSKKLVNEVLNGTKGVDGKSIKETQAWAASAAKQAPAWLRSEVPDLGKRYAAYVNKGTLIEEKLRQGAYRQGGIYSQHARCYEKTRRVLYRNLNSGKTYRDVMKDLQVNVWGVDPKSLNKSKRKGVVASVKRLVRSEYQYAANANRQTLGQADPAIIGYEITTDVGVCEVCEGLYGQRTFIYGKDEVYTPPAESHPNCGTGDLVISGPKPEATTRRWYEGDMLKVRTKLGREFTVTPNHPILTPKGFVAISELNSGCNVFSSVDSKALFSIVNPDDDYIEATFKEVFELHRITDGVASRSVKVSPEDFHNDGLGSEVGIINSNRLLRSELDTELIQIFLKQLLVRRNNAALSFNAFCACLALLNRRLRATAGNVRGASECPSIKCSASVISHLIGLADSAYINTHPDKHLVDFPSANPEIPVKRIDGLTGDVSALQFAANGVAAGLMAIDSIASVDSFNFTGHVYNLQNSMGLYIANGVASSNCHCTITGYVYKKPEDITAAQMAELKAPMKPEKTAPLSVAIGAA